MNCSAVAFTVKGCESVVSDLVISSLALPLKTAETSLHLFPRSEYRLAASAD